MSPETSLDSNLSSLDSRPTYETDLVDRMWLVVTQPRVYCPIRVTWVKERGNGDFNAELSWGAALILLDNQEGINGALCLRLSEFMMEKRDDGEFQY